MSTYKTERKESIAEYLAATRNLRRMTIRVIKKFPTSYRYSITNNMLTLAADAYTNAMKADTIRLTKDSDPHDYDLRHRLLMLSLTNINALAGEITFCYFLLGGQNNIFKSRTSYNKTFKNWTQTADTAYKKVQNAISSDEKFWGNNTNG